MKKIYQKPVTEIIKTALATSLLDLSSVAVGNAYQENDAVLSRGRGDYEPADETDNFGDLW